MPSLDPMPNQGPSLAAHSSSFISAAGSHPSRRFLNSDSSRLGMSRKTLDAAWHYERSFLKEKTLRREESLDERPTRRIELPQPSGDPLDWLHHEPSQAESVERVPPHIDPTKLDSFLGEVKVQLDSLSAQDEKLDGAYGFVEKQLRQSFLHRADNDLIVNELKRTIASKDLELAELRQ